MALQRVLYTEDEADIREVAAISLEDVGGLDVRLCPRGEDTLAAALEFAPQLILLDVMMPTQDGIATFRLLKEHPLLAEIPVIFLTAKAQKREIANLMETGAIGVIAKPFDPLTLADEVRRLWKDYGGD